MPPSSKKKITRKPVARNVTKNVTKKKITKRPVAKAHKIVSTKRIGQTVMPKQPVVVTSLPVKRSSILSSLGFQVFIAGSAAVVLLALGVVGQGLFATHGSRAADTPPTTVGLEHASPLSLTFVLARKDQAGYVNITNDSPDQIRLSVPAAWRRVEVQGALLKDVTADLPDPATARWTLPGKASIRMVVGDVPDSVLFQSTSPASAAVTVKSIDLGTEQIRTDVLLLKDHATANLWGEE